MGRRNKIFHWERNRVGQSNKKVGPIEIQIFAVARGTLYLYYPVEIIRVAKYWSIQTEGRRPEVCIVNLCRHKEETKTTVAREVNVCRKCGT